MASGSLTMDETGYARGRYLDLCNQLKLLFEPNENFRGGKVGDPEKPTHTVYVDTPGGPVAVGAVWQKIQKRGQGQGQAFYSFSVDDPSMAVPLHLTAFPTQQKGDFEIVWRRQRQAADAS